MRALLTTCLLLALLVPPTAAREEWYDHYVNALAALERGDHAAAIESIETALGRKKRSGYLRTYGNNYMRYVPHYQLGVALHGAGECEAALASFERSEDRGETTDVPEFATRLKRLREECEIRLAPPPEPIVTAVAEPEPVEEPKPGRPPIDHAQLERALASYLGADFEASIASFENLVQANPDSPRMRLLLGMSLHGAWVMAGENDAALIERARTELAGAADLDPALVPDPALCPPRVAALYRSLR